MRLVKLGIAVSPTIIIFDMSTVVKPQQPTNNYCVYITELINVSSYILVEYSSFPLHDNEESNSLFAFM